MLTAKLSHREATPGLALEERDEVFGFLFRGAKPRQHLCPSGQHMLPGIRPEEESQGQGYTPMLPVSGAEQLVACGAIIAEWPMISAMTAY